MKVTTQLTSKPLKLAVIITNTLIIISLLGIIGADDKFPMISLFLMSCIARMITGCLIWWNHE